jgi:hypothetical protein
VCPTLWSAAFCYIDAYKWSFVNVIFFLLGPAREYTHSQSHFRNSDCAWWLYHCASRWCRVKRISQSTQRRWFWSLRVLTSLWFVSQTIQFLSWLTTRRRRIQSVAEVYIYPLMHAESLTRGTEWKRQHLRLLSRLAQNMPRTRPGWPSCISTVCGWMPPNFHSPVAFRE